MEYIRKWHYLFNKRIQSNRTKPIKVTPEINFCDSLFSLFIQSLESPNDYQNKEKRLKVTQKIKLLRRIIKNSNSKKILYLLKDNNELSITQIAQNIGVSYQNTHSHIKRLKEVGLIETKIVKAQGNPIYIKIAPYFFESRPTKNY